MTKCTFPKSSNYNVEITCVLDEPLYDYVEIEYQVIRDGLNELFTFTEIRSDEKFNWGEETSTEEEEEAEKPTLYYFIKIIFSLNNILFLRYINIIII